LRGAACGCAAWLVLRLGARFDAVAIGVSPD